MRVLSSLLVTILASMLLLASMPAAADMRLAAAKLSVPGIAAQGLTLALSSGNDGELRADLSIDKLDVPALGWRGVRAHCDCSLLRKGTQQWQLHGGVALQGAPGSALRRGTLALNLDVGQNTLEFGLAQAKARVDVSLPLDQVSHMRINLSKLPVTWLQGILADVWTQGRLGAGQVDARLVVDILDQGLRSAGRFTLIGGGLDSRDGSIAAEALGAQGHWSLDSSGSTTTLALDTQLSGGEVLLGALYAKLPAQAAQLRLQAGFADDGVQLRKVHFDDGSAMRFDGDLDFATDGSLRLLRMNGVRATFPQAYQRYAKSWLDSHGFAGLDTAGMLTGSMMWQMGHLDRFAFDAEGLRLVDPQGRIGMRGLSGRIDWANTGERKPSQLHWEQLELLQLPLGPAQTEWQSRDGSLQLLRPATLPMLAGEVFLQKLAWTPAAGTAQDRLDLALAFAGVDLARLSTLFGFPAFRGTAGGAIPGLHYRGGHLELDGGVSVNVFDGFVDVTRLTLMHPFGAAPVLTAAIAFRDLDLAPMTRVFDFGSITGRLSGKIDKLRMINWGPVAFEAAVHANNGGRISQKAINSISTLGGGGIAGGVQAAVLKVFDSFGYQRIGLSCVLNNDVCTMGGLGAADGGGYTIVEGRGLPHISVIGHQKEVDWSTLVERLKAATSGGGVTIQ